MCGKCIEVCPLGIESLNIKKAQRAKTYYKLKSDFNYLLQVEMPENKSEDKVVYFAGCMSHLTPKITRSMVKIFEQVKENYEFLDADGSICCGRPMMLTGKVNEAKALIAKNTELIRKSGAKRLVLSCPIWALAGTSTVVS